MNPYDAYATAAKTSMSDREVEAAALTKAALLLTTCQQNWEAPDRPCRLAEALDFNQKLWTIFETALADPNHPLPRELRQDILRLGLFVDQRIFETLAFPDPQKLTAIVRINLNLAAGLREGTDAGPRPHAPAKQAEEEVWA